MDRRLPLGANAHRATSLAVAQLCVSVVTASPMRYVGVTGPMSADW